MLVERDLGIDDALKKTIGHNVLFIRKRLGLTQIELGKKCYLSKSVISNIENGNYTLTNKILHKLAEALEVTLDVLEESNVEINKLIEQLQANLPDNITDTVRLIRKVRNRGGREQVKAWFCWARIRYYRKEFYQARRVYEKATRIAKVSGDTDLIFKGLYNQAWTYLMIGMFENAVGLIEDIKKLPCSDKFLGEIHFAIGSLYHDNLNLQQAEPHLLQCIKNATGVTLAQGYQRLADIYRLKGDIAGCQINAGFAIDNARLFRHPLTEIYSMRTLGELHYGIGDFIKASKYFHEALAIAMRLTSLSSEIPIIKLYIALSDRNYALANEQLVLVEMMGYTPSDLRICIRELGKLANQEGRTQVALELYEKAFTLYDQYLGR